MTDKKLKSADHKQIITKLMQDLSQKVELPWVTQFYKDQAELDPDAETVIDLASYSNEKCWKRTRKYTEIDPDTGRLIVLRDFAHVSCLGTVTVSESFNDEGGIHIEVEMKNLPDPFRKALNKVDTMIVDGVIGPVLERSTKPPKQSMLDTPKPEGFGAFS